MKMDLFSVAVILNFVSERKRGNLETDLPLLSPLLSFQSSLQITGKLSVVVRLYKH